MDQHASKQTAVEANDENESSTSTTVAWGSSSEEPIRIRNIVPKIIQDDATLPPLPPLPPILASPSTTETDAHYTVGTVTAAATINQTTTTTTTPTATATTAATTAAINATIATTHPAPQSLQIAVHCPFVCVFSFLEFVQGYTTVYNFFLFYRVVGLIIIHQILAVMK